MCDDLEADGFQAEHTATRTQFQKQEELLEGLHEGIVGCSGQLGHLMYLHIPQNRTFANNISPMNLNRALCYLHPYAFPSLVES